MKEESPGFSRGECQFCHKISIGYRKTVSAQTPALVLWPFRAMPLKILYISPEVGCMLGAFESKKRPEVFGVR
jgi:hypothetical protein